MQPDLSIFAINHLVTLVERCAIFFCLILFRRQNYFKNCAHFVKFINFCYFRGFFPIIWLLWYPIMMMYVYGSFAGVECWFDLLKYTNWLDQLPTISIGRLEFSFPSVRFFFRSYFRLIHFTDLWFCYYLSTAFFSFKICVFLFKRR